MKKPPSPVTDPSIQRANVHLLHSQKPIHLGDKLKMKQALTIAALLWALPLLSQSTTGELRLTVTDPTGSGLRSSVELTSQSNEYRNTFTTDEHGNLDAKRLPYGIYQVRILAQGFAQSSASVDIHSALPSDRTIRLKVGSVSEVVKVVASDTLVDPYRAGSVNEVGLETIQNRLSALPGRSMQDLVNSEPGWLYEGNAVLHPRGSEYQTQFVVDGIPLTDNRSPSFGPEPSKPMTSNRSRSIQPAFPRNMEERWAASLKSTRSRNQILDFTASSLFLGALTPRARLILRTNTHGSGIRLA
jgi:hypothetical protein